MLEKIDKLSSIESKQLQKQSMDDFLKQYMTKTNHLDAVPDSTPMLAGEDVSKLILEKEESIPLMQAVNPSDIYFAEQDLRGFAWEHHGNTKESYQALIKSYQEVEKLKDLGLSLEEIKNKEPCLSKAVSSGFESRGIPTVYSWEDKYIWADNGRHRIMMAQEMGLTKMNVLVKGSYLDEASSTQVKE